MLKRISPTQVEMGMFVHKLEGSWLKHPFWKSKFLLEDNDTLFDLRDSEIDAVVIDISKGRDVIPPRHMERDDPLPSTIAAPPSGFALRRRTTRTPAPDPHSNAPQSTAREFGQARSIANRGTKLVNKVFLEARLGKAVKAQEVEPVIEDIFASVQRNPHAFNGLMRCKRENEYIYRHALACSALMISLARQMKLSPGEIREAGLAGLLFDVGVNHLPIDHEETQGDYRRLPPEIRAQHTQLGYNFLIASGLPEKIAQVALQHHERADGSGYPLGLHGHQISLLSRMAAICDAYDVLVSGGVDLPAVDPGAAVQKLSEMAGKFDPVVLRAFIEAIGIYPIGAFVLLRSQRMAMVIDQDPTDYNRPKVRCFYSVALGKRVAQEEIALAACYGADEILGPADLTLFEPEEVLAMRQRLFTSACQS